MIAIFYYWTRRAYAEGRGGGKLAFGWSVKYDIEPGTVSGLMVRHRVGTGAKVRNLDRVRRGVGIGELRSQRAMTQAINTIKGELVVTKQRFAIVVSRFNEFVSSRLLSAAVDTLERHGCPTSNITAVWVPGAWELPLTARQVASNGQYDAVICLGCVIRGETPHFDYVASEAAKGIAQVGLEARLPVVFGVLTADTLEQAINRAGAKAGNKGADAALAAIEMVNLFAQLDKKK